MEQFLDQISNSGVWLPPVFGLTILLLALPLHSRGARVAIAGVLLLLGISIGVAATDAIGAEDRSLEVVNYFPPEKDGPEDAERLEPFVSELQTAPAWAWLATAAGLMFLAALGTFLTRGKDKQPSIWLHPTAVALFFVLARLAFEKTAAPEGLVWATGASFSMLPIAVYIGLYASRRGSSIFGMLGWTLLHSILVRGAITGIGYYATTQSQGSHLDVHRITSTASPLIGTREFANPTDAFVWLIAIPQMAMWTVMTVIATLALGSLSRWLANRGGDDGDEAEDFAHLANSSVFEPDGPPPPLE